MDNRAPREIKQNVEVIYEISVERYERYCAICQGLSSGMNQKSIELIFSTKLDRDRLYRCIKCQREERRGGDDRTSVTNQVEI